MKKKAGRMVKGLNPNADKVPLKKRRTQTELFEQELWA
jgi:hypothetical protein